MSTIEDHPRDDPADQEIQERVREGGGAGEERRHDVEDEGGVGGGVDKSGKEFVFVELFVRKKNDGCCLCFERKRDGNGGGRRRGCGRRRTRRGCGSIGGDRMRDERPGWRRTLHTTSECSRAIAAILKHVKAWLISYSRAPAKLKLPIFKIDVF